MPASLDMQKVTADVCAEMFGIVAELASEYERTSGGIGSSIAVPTDLLERAHALNTKLTAAPYPHFKTPRVTIDTEVGASIELWISRGSQ